MAKVNKEILIGISAAAVMLIILWLLTENKRKQELIDELEIDRLKLIKDSIENTDQLSSEIKGQLNKLVDEYKSINPEISSELATALSIINSGEEEKGIGCLSIIIEKMLKLKYSNDKGFADWLKREKKKPAKKASQADLIEYAKQDQLINQEEFQFANAVRILRNGTFHEAGKKLSWNSSKAGLLIGVELVLKIGRKLQIEGILKIETYG